MDVREYEKVMKPDDIRWIKHHLSLATMNPTTDIVEFTKQFMDSEPPTRVAALKKAAPTYDELEKKYHRRRKPRTAMLLRGCFCLPQNYCDVCQED